MNTNSALAWLSGITAALGACLACYGTGSSHWMGIAVMLVATAALALSIIGMRRHKYTIERLHRQLIDFLEGRLSSPRFSVDDDDFALLENAVVELENRLMLERENTQRESQKNAAFIADVSHQLKTPLAALKLYCEMEQARQEPATGTGALTDQAMRPETLAGQSDYPAGKKLLQHPNGDISKQLALIERMEHLIYSLLRLEKLRSDAYEISFASHDLADLVGQIWAELQPLYPEKKFRLAGSAMLRCDGYWISEALQNILKNSCEHTPPKGEIGLSLETAEKSITITIEDNGGGVPETELPRLFRRFYRSSRVSLGGGAGLGLAIARIIVEKHHGLISAENTASGLQISLCFPRMEGIQKIG
ncbi:MAG: HAMP domain-containing histidine kinase [Firmicutes bacterium]|nr:HAMP domain-containing histidine kinase [Bacillota bacterium]